MLEETKITYEKLGHKAMTDIQLLAMSLNITESRARNICESAKDWKTLFGADLKTLQSHGFTQHQARMFDASNEIYRRYESEQVKGDRMTCAGDAYKYLKHHLGHLVVEEFHVLYLDRNNRIKDHFNASKGNVTSTIFPSKLIMRRAVQFLTNGIVLAHNHPSGNLKPSDQDIKVTKKMDEMCKLFDIQLVDHLIVTSEGYYSFADEGII